MKSRRPTARSSGRAAAGKSLCHNINCKRVYPPIFAGDSPAGSNPQLGGPWATLQPFAQHSTQQRICHAWFVCRL
jgi:hypothetical protein